MADENSPAPGRGRRGTDRTRRRWRRGVPSALLAAVCVTTLVAALTGAVKPLAHTPFALSGHWVYNSVLRTAFHIDGATTNIDAQVPVAAAPGSQVVQGDTNGYVVSPTVITGFDKATLSVRQPVAPPVDEVPLGIEAVGGPYLVYRTAGKIVRLGDPVATISVGGAVDDPLVTGDGTMWLHRTDVGLICTLPKGAGRISGCPVATPKGHPGALTMIRGRLAFVDLFTDRLHVVRHDALGPGRPLGVAVSPDSRVAATDLAGRVVLLDPERHSLLLADTGNAPAEPVTIALPGDDYDGPVSTGSSVVVVDRQDGTMLTFGPNGDHVDTARVGHAGGRPRISHGEDNRVYVENPSGTKVLVVAPNGTVRDVPVSGKPDVRTPTHAVPTTTPTAVPTGRSGSQPTESAGSPAPVDTPTQPRQPVAPPASAPGAPDGVSASAGDGTATVRWGAAADNRSTIRSYLVSWRGSSGRTGSVTVGGHARHVTVHGLTNGLRYVLTVTATNGVGSGPGVSAAPVTPVAAAAAPKPTAGYRNGTATVSWARPDLNGGHLVDYLVSATGQAERTVTATATSYTGLAAGRTITFTVRAVTTSPDGRQLTGAAGSTSLTVPEPKITISRGAATTSSNCDAPDCADVDASMTGFAPDTRYSITLSSSSNPDVQTESFSTDANGDAEYDQLDYDVPGETVWISVPTPDGTVSSNKIVWE